MYTSNNTFHLNILKF